MYGKIDLGKISSLIQELKKEMQVSQEKGLIFEDVVWNMIEIESHKAIEENQGKKYLYDIHAENTTKWEKLQRLHEISKSDKRFNRVVKMDESHRPKKEAGTWVGTLECEEKHETARMKIIRFYLHSPEDELCAKQLAAQGGIKKLKAELTRIEARIYKRYIRAIKLEQDRSEPVPASLILKQISWNR